MVSTIKIKVMSVAEFTGEQDHADIWVNTVRGPSSELAISSPNGQIGGFVTAPNLAVLDAPFTIGEKTYPVGTDISIYSITAATDAKGAPVQIYSFLIGRQSPLDYSLVFLIPGRSPQIGDVFTYEPDAQRLDGFADPFLFPQDNAAPCFTRGTLIETARGPIPVEAIRAGDLVLTLDHGLRPVSWVGGRSLSARDLDAAPHLRPIRIRAGALGLNTPTTDLLVSPQHRILLRSAIAAQMFGASEILMAAKRLAGLSGIYVETRAEGVDYFHLLFDRHEIIRANGAETESFYPGPEALKAVDAAARVEILELFPELARLDSPPCFIRPVASGMKAKKAVLRHAANNRALVA